VVDGTELLRKGRFVVKREIQVQDQGAPVTMLNELEMVRGELYANVWQSTRIAVISLETGRVLRWIDLSDLLSPLQQGEVDAVLNGIAYDAASQRLFVTGKLWPKIYQIQEVPKK
jgi:glutamine cyclotransferase